MAPQMDICCRPGAVMEGRPKTAPLLDLSVPVLNDSSGLGIATGSAARPIDLLAAVAARTRKVMRHRGFLPALRNRSCRGASARDARSDRRGAARARGGHRQRHA
jgi:hypothetical protein